MKILVTGANGFIGRRLCARLSKQGFHVFGLSHHKPSEQDIKFKDYFVQDLTKPFSLSGYFDVIVHLAAYNITNIGAQDPHQYALVNVEGTRHLLKGVKADQFVYLSTAKVYKNEGLEITEDSPLCPQGFYEQSKLQAENACRQILPKESLAVLRSVNVVGYGQAPKAVLPVFFAKACTNQPLELIGSGAVMMQYIYVEDLIDSIEAVIGRKAAGLFNLAHPRPITVEQLARAVINLTNSHSVLNIHQARPPLFSPVNCDKSRNELGWAAKTAMPKILEEYYQQYVKTFKN